MKGKNIVLDNSFGVALCGCFNALVTIMLSGVLVNSALGITVVVVVAGAKPVLVTTVVQIAGLVAELSAQCQSLLHASRG